MTVTAQPAASRRSGSGDAAEAAPWMGRLVGLAIAPAGVLLFFLVWYLASTQLPASRLASPWVTGVGLWRNLINSPRLAVFGLGKTGYAALLLYTARNVLTGLVLGSAIGILIGVASARLRLLRLVIDPIVLVMGTVPVLIAAPLFLLWFGVVPYTQVLLVTIYSLVTMIIFSQRAVANLNPVYELAATTQGGNWLDRMRFVLIPGILPEILGGLRITLASAWGLETFTEILGAPSGIGQAIKALTNVNDVAGLLACVTLVAIAAIVMDTALVLLARRITRWA
jgi:ABC-type nitrate/sulfonate/bicarbonate transport system permease component